MTRNAIAVWLGSGKEGHGTLNTQSGTLTDTPYSAVQRFGEEKGTNPEELIAAAHAGCFAMALAFQLSGAGHPPERLETRADVSMVKEGEGWRIDAVALQLKAKVPDIEREKFNELAEKAKAGCPVSKLLNAKITLQADLI
ncbi:MAG TPA: OsmC family protein [Xanthobacteraceae bacterium]|nr:OsmC family protein [Xanthobacteraceae bacterium]